MYATEGFTQELGVFGEVVLDCFVELVEQFWREKGGNDSRVVEEGIQGGNRALTVGLFSLGGSEDAGVENSDDFLRFLKGGSVSWFEDVLHGDDGARSAIQHQVKKLAAGFVESFVTPEVVAGEKRCRAGCGDLV